MTEYKFKTGDVVRLKSGGPPMTVGSIPSSEHSYGPRVEVVWARNERLRYEAVPPETLVLVDEIDAEAKQLKRELQEEIKNSVRLSYELTQAKDQVEQLRRDLEQKSQEREQAYAACERADARTRDFRALAAKLVELDRENLPVDVKSLIAEARLAVSR